MALTDNRTALEALKAKAIELPDANSSELKVAIGTISSMASAVTISGLGFTPKHVVIMRTATEQLVYSSTQQYRTAAMQMGLHQRETYTRSASSSTHYLYSSSGTGTSPAEIQITEDGFIVTPASYAKNDRSFDYIAIGL